MSQTTASALNNRVVNFVNVVNEYTCVICNQVADEANTLQSGMCGGVFCNGCKDQALELFDLNTIALKDENSRMEILDKDVYCPNSNRQGTSRKRKANRTENCSWIGKYNQLAAHLDQCDDEKLHCIIAGCEAMIERKNFQIHQQSCPHRIDMCVNCAFLIKSCDLHDHLNMDCPKAVVDCQCGFECERDALPAHRDKDCPMVEIMCDVIGCDAMERRGDNGKHQEQAACHHVHALSVAAGQLLVNINSVEREKASLIGLVDALNKKNKHLQDLVNNTKREMNNNFVVQVGVVKQENDRLRERLDQLAKVVEEKNVQKILRIEDIAKKMIAAAVHEMSHESPRFDVFFGGIIHKLYIRADIQGNRLGLDLCKDFEASNDKSSLSVGGSSITVNKIGKIDRKRTFPSTETMDSDHSSLGWCNFLDNLSPFIDNDKINIILDLKFNKVDEPLVL